MTTIALEDNDLPLADYSALELRLHELGVVLRPHGEVYTTAEGQQRARLASPAAEFDEGHTSAVDVEQALGTFGFRKKSE
jgi:hypothetical protein